MHVRERRKERGEALLQKEAGLAPDEGLDIRKKRGDIVSSHQDVPM